MIVEENQNVIFGIYVMGIKKRPELSNKPCVLQYLEEDKKLVLAFTLNGSVENVFFDGNKIISAKNVPRTIISQNEFKDTSVNEFDVNTFAITFGGAYGSLVGNLVNKSGLLNSSNSGAVTYTSLNELHVTYINDDNEQRDLVIQTDLDIDNFIALINK